MKDNTVEETSKAQAKEDSCRGGESPVLSNLIRRHGQGPVIHDVQSPKRGTLPDMGGLTYLNPWIFLIPAGLGWPVIMDIYNPNIGQIGTLRMSDAMHDPECSVGLQTESLENVQVIDFRQPDGGTHPT